MRDIIFRGKLVGNGKWAYGNLEVKTDKVCIITPDDTLIGKYGVVIPETVGQYTGLTDKNGTKIFEGDILEIVGEEKDMITEEEQRFVVKWQYEDCGFNLLCWLNYKVIGNVHDNPELLKVDVDNA